MEENINAQVEELKNNEIATEAVAEQENTQTEAKKEETVGEVLNDEPKEKTVPESVLIKYKKENKQLVKEIKELKEKIVSEDMTEEEISDEIKSLADEHNIDSAFLKKLSNAIKKESEKSIKSEISNMLKPLEEKEKAEKMSKIFEEHYNKTIEAMPEFKDIANKEVIKTLAQDSKNKNKTFPQLLEESYGHLIKGKRTIDASKPRGGKEESDIDFSRAKSDTEYFKSIMNDPELKLKYNSEMLKRINL